LLHTHLRCPDASAVVHLQYHWVKSHRWQTRLPSAAAPAAPADRPVAQPAGAAGAAADGGRMCHLYDVTNTFEWYRIGRPPTRRDTACACAASAMSPQMQPRRGGAQRHGAGGQPGRAFGCITGKQTPKSAARRLRSRRTCAGASVPPAASLRPSAAPLRRRTRPPCVAAPAAPAGCMVALPPALRSRAPPRAVCGSAGQNTLCTSTCSIPRVGRRLIEDTGARLCMLLCVSA